MYRLFLISGAVLCAFSIILGAAGSHMLTGSASTEQQAWFDTALRYHQFNALGALISGGLIFVGFDSRWTIFGGLGLLIGTVLFSGSLYTMAALDWRALGLMTPIGGTLLIAGWSCLAYGIYCSRSSTEIAGKKW